MQTKSSTPTPAGTPDSAADQSVSDKAPTNSGQKAAATLRRRKDERRAESLRQIRAQTADGSLVVRQMTPAQHEEATEVARQALARNEAGRKRKRTPDTRESA